MGSVTKAAVTGAVAFLAGKYGAPFVAPYTAGFLGKYNDDVCQAAIAAGVAVLIGKVL